MKHYQICHYHHIHNHNNSYDCPETALNVIFKNAIAEFYEQNSYKVYSDQSRIIESNNPHASRYLICIKAWSSSV